MSCCYTSPKSLRTINENSAHFDIYAEWLYTADDTPKVPASLSYRIDDVYTGTNIRPDTSVTPQSPKTAITIDAADSVLLSQSNRYEKRRVTVTGTFSDGTQDSFEYDFLVRNLRFVEA